MIPAWDTTLETIRNWAAEFNQDPDALSLHLFDTELDNLLEWQAMKIYESLFSMRLARNKLPGHSHICFGCENEFTCFCLHPEHEHGECSSCHEGIGLRPVPQYDYKREGEIRIASIGVRPQKFIDYK